MDIDRVAERAARGPHALAEAGLVYEAIAALAPEFRDAIVAVDLVGLRYGEAANALGIRPGTVATRLFRARQRVAASVGTRDALARV